jgi:fimbrial chaperone protein
MTFFKRIYMIYQVMTIRAAECKGRIFHGKSILKCIVFLSLIVLFPSEGLPVNFSINPVRIFFEGVKKTDILTIKNESTKSVALQMTAFAWTQDEKGENVYAPTEDILFFPKLLEIKPGEEKIIRIGKKISLSDTEKTYRLFIEEIPDNSKAETTSVRILTKVGVPIFIPPLKTSASGAIEKIELNRSGLRLGVKNDGNVHFIIRSIRVAGNDSAGKEVYDMEEAGGYLHHGRSKEFAFEIPQDACRNMKTLNVHIDTDRLTMGKQIEIVEEMCKP